MKTTILRSFALLLAFSWGMSVAFSQVNPEYKAQIQKMNMAMKESMLSGKSFASLDYYTKDAISLPANEPMREGIDAIRKAEEDMMKNGWKITSFEPMTYKISSSGKLVTEVGMYKMSMTGPGMDKPMEDVGKYLTVYEVQPDKTLRIKIETWNSDKNPMEKKE